MEQRVVFGASGGRAAGLGHVRRCLSLAGALTRRGAACRFLIDGVKDVGDWVAAAGYPAVSFSPSGVLVPSLEGMVEGWSATVIVVDSYDVPTKGFRTLLATGATVVAIDDLADRELPVHLVVNGGVGAERLDYRGLPATRYLLGPAYALLRPEFAAEPAREFAGAVRRVFVAAGGSDPLGLLPRLVGWAHKALPEAGIDVLASPLVAEGLVERLAGVESRPEGRTNAGEDGPALAKIQESDRDGPGTRLRARGRDESRPYTGQGRSKQRPYMAGGPGGDDGADAGWVVIHRDPPDVRGLMLGADVALCAGGQTTYELAATGTPAIAVQVAANQAGNLRGLEAAGALVWAGSVEDADLGDRVMAALAALAGDGARRAAMSRAGRALVDGKGIERVAEALLARAGALQACRE